MVVLELYIHTLGDFDILFDGKSILKITAKSYKIYKLFQYFITYRGRKLLPETIIDNLYEDNEFNDPKNVLRTQIFRLRQILKKFISNGVDESKYFDISVINGYYCFGLGDLSILDIDEFERYIAEGDKYKPYNLEKSLMYYKKAMEIYKGHYLSINAYETWLVPIRNRYSRLFIKTFYKTIEILEFQGDSYGIIEICEDALTIEPCEETIHICMMDAMLKLGQIKNAMSHYAYLVELLNKEIGVKPSSALKNVYRKIQSHYDEKGEINIDNISVKLEDKIQKGALLCDVDYFKFLYNIEKRRESNIESFIGLVTLVDYSARPTEESKKVLNILTALLEEILGRGDVYSFWNDNQILMFLYEVKESDLSRIKKRIKDDFAGNLKKESRQILLEFKPLKSDINKNLLYKAY